MRFQEHVEYNGYQNASNWLSAWFKVFCIWSMITWHALIVDSASRPPFLNCLQWWVLKFDVWLLILIVNANEASQVRRKVQSEPHLVAAYSLSRSQTVRLCGACILHAKWTMCMAWWEFTKSSLVSSVMTSIILVDLEVRPRMCILVTGIKEDAEHSIVQ